jgi:hypothetical protein
VNIIPLNERKTAALLAVPEVLERSRRFDRTDVATAPCQRAKSASGQVSKNKEKAQEKRAYKFALRDKNAELTTINRCRFCGRQIAKADELAVLIVLDPPVGRGVQGVERAVWQGVQTCGSVWACPVCAAKIRHVRSLEIDAGSRAHLKGGGGVLMLTATIRHERLDTLKATLPVLTEGMGFLMRGRAFETMKEAIGYLGSIRTVEVTHGLSAGWHPHLHVLLFTEQPLTDREIAKLHEYLWERWKVYAEKETGRTVLKKRFTLEPVRSIEAIGKYLTKIVDESGRRVGDEMTRLDMKQGRHGSRSPWQLLEAGWTGDDLARALWQEYEQATKGRRCVVWSSGLKERLGVGAEVPDEQLATDDGAGAGQQLVARVPVTVAEFYAVRQVKGGFARALDVAENNGPDALRLMLALALAGQPGDLRPAPVWSDTGEVWRPNRGCDER